MEVHEKKRRVTTHCCVPQCNNYLGQNISFHKFPMDVVLRKKWVMALRIGKAVSNSMRVCGAHFKSEDFFPGANKQRKHLKLNTVPSQKVPLRSFYSVDTPEKTERKKQRSERAKKRNLLVHETENVAHNQIDNETENNPTVDEEPRENEQSMLEPKNKDMGVQTDLQEPPEGQLHNLKTRDKKFILLEVLTDKSKLYTYTGLSSFELLDTIIECVSEIEKESATNKKELSLKERITLTFVKLKVNMSFTALAVLFGISRHTCSNYFNEIMPLLSAVLESVIPWPTQEEIRKNIPIAFKNYRSTRVVLDCAEIPIEKSKCIKCRILSYSHYKKGHTAKVEFCIAPSGLITTVSLAYGGRASDKFITNDCGVLNRLDYNDAVMVDKGFIIENECLERNLVLVKPSFLSKKKQVSKAEALKTAEIARARVHVKRVIQRVREYAFLKSQVPWGLVHYLDDALIIVSGIVNLSNPIMKIDKFM